MKNSLSQEALSPNDLTQYNDQLKKYKNYRNEKLKATPSLSKLKELESELYSNGGSKYSGSKDCFRKTTFGYSK